MTLLFIDSFEHYPTASNGFGGGVDQDASMEAGNYLDCQHCRQETVVGGYSNTPGIRTGSRALGFAREANGTNNPAVESWAKVWTDTATKQVAGFSLYVEGGSNRLTPIFRFIHDDGFSNEYVHVEIRRTSINGLAAYRGETGGAFTLLGASAGDVINLASVNYLEIKVQYDDGVESPSDGEVVIRVNGCEVLNLQNIDTTHPDAGVQTGNVCGPYTFGGDLTSDEVERHVYDDLYVLNQAGSVNNDFLGDVQVYDLEINGAGDFAQWSSESGESPSLDNYENVDDSPEPDSDSTYNWSNTIGAKDLYAVDNLPTGTLEVFGVQVTGFMRREIGGDRDVKLKVRLASGSPEQELESPGIALDTAYSWNTHIFEKKPGGGSWTPTDVDEMQIGVEVSEGSP